MELRNTKHFFLQATKHFINLFSMLQKKKKKNGKFDNDAVLIRFIYIFLIKVIALY